MKNKLILSAPTAKIQIGNQGSITLDTATHNGKKSFQINIVSENDTVTKEIEDVVSEIKDEVAQDLKNEFKDENDQESYRYHSEVRNEKMPFEVLADKAFPILVIIIVFGYMAFKSYQNRKWKEALLNKGMDADEIQKLVKPEDSFDKKLKENDLEGYEKRKMFKWAIVLGSFGTAILFGTMMGESGYFFGIFPLLLALGFFYYYKKTN